MARKDLDVEIHSRINAFLGELSQLVKRQALEAVHEALGEAATPRRGPGRPPAAAKAGRRGKRTSAQVEAIAAKVLAQVRSKPGQRLEELGRSLKTATGVLKLPIAKLLAAKKLKTQGRKRGTKYFPK